MSDKERLEEIENKKFFDVVNGELLKLENVNRLIEQAERLEKENKRLRRELSIEKGCRYNESYVHGLEDENKRLREALEFYASEANYSELLHIHGAIKTCVTCDKGEIARKALEGTE